MIDLLIIALLQATDPQTAAVDAPATETTAETPAANAPPQTGPDVDVNADAPREERRCEQAAPTGSRVRTRRVTCTTRESRDAAAETARGIANSGGAAGQSGEAVGRGQ